MPLHGEKFKIYVTWVSKVRIRNRPGFRGAVLGHLREGEHVYYLGKKSDFRSRVVLRGKRYYTFWIQIKSVQGMVGWVYKGTLKPWHGRRRGLLRDQILSYGKLKTWSGVVSGWDGDSPRVNIMDPYKYHGHYDFVMRGLGLGLSKNAFYMKIHYPQSRKFMPFFAYDLRDMPIACQGKVYKWVLELRLYRFYDKPRHFIGELTRLAGLVSRKLGLGSGMPIIIISRKKSSRAWQNRPNTDDIPELKKKGFLPLYLNELLEKAKAKKVTVLNPGVAVGRLRLLKDGNKSDLYNLDRDDIVIFKHIPKRVPPVAGIVTLQPQTPLSHVNLLARNRGTVNLYLLKLEDVPGLKQAVGKFVKITAKNNRVALEILSRRDVRQWKKNHPGTRVSIPRPLKKYRIPIPFSRRSSSRFKVNAIGAKAANYALLQRKLGTGRVKPGMAIGFGLYYRVFRKSGAQKRLRNLLRNAGRLSSRGLRDRLKKIRKRIKRYRISRRLLRKIREKMYKKYGNIKIRLRSSTNCEDLPDFNGAGLYTSCSYRIKKSIHSLEKKLLKVFASLWNYNAFRERQFYNIDQRLVGMAVLINPAFSGELANGVVVTVVDPGTGKISVWVNAQPSDFSVANPRKGQVPESFRFPLGDRFSRTILNRSNMGAVFLINSGVGSDVYRKLASLTGKIHYLLTSKRRHSKLPFGVDIEFKIMGNLNKPELWIKQARLLLSPLP